MRLPCPWDSPGKNTGVGCHFLLQCMKVEMKVNLLSHIQLLATPWTAAYQAPLPMGFSRQEYWSGMPLPDIYSKNEEEGVFSPSSLSFDYKNVAHLIQRAEPPHLPAYTSPKCAILINLPLAYHLASR